MDSKYVKSYKSDIYIMIPFTMDTNMDIKEEKEDMISEEFLSYMEENSIYECNSKVTKDLKRKFLGKNYLACLNYNYDGKILDKELVYLFLTEHKSTGIYVLTIMDLKNKFSPTQIEDQVTTDNILLYDENDNTVDINTYMKEKYGLNRCGEAKILLSISNKPKDFLEFKSMLACETYKTFVENGQYYKLTSKEIEKICDDNFSEYDFYEIYASRSSIVYVLNTFSDDSIANIQDEIPILFIIELIMFQNAAVLRTNNKIIEQLSENETVSLSFIEDLYKEFGKTIRFWNKNVFKYITVQNISSKINEAFGTKNIIDEYYKNQDFLEHIVNLRDIQNSNRESKVLNIIVLILTLVQVIPVILEFLNWVFSLNIHVNYLYIINISVVLLVLIIILLNRKIKKNKNRKIRELR